MDKPILSQIADDFNARAVAQGWAARCDPTLAFQRPELATVNQTWHQMAAGRPLPSRLEMTPRVLKDWLPHVAFYERVGTDDGGRRYRVRLLGSAYLSLFGELTGQYLDEVLPADAVPIWEAVLDTILAHGAPLRFMSRSEITGKDFLVSEYCSAPLTDPAGNATHVMAVGYYSPGKWSQIADVVRDRPASV